MDANTYYTKKHALCLELANAIGSAFPAFLRLQEHELKFHGVEDNQDPDVRLIGMELLNLIVNADGLSDAVEPLAQAAARAR
ncbi:hypothetical protein EBU60_02870 [bacterium]|nr:hypothetical protein [bacterium]